MHAIGALFFIFIFSPQSIWKEEDLEGASVRAVKVGSQKPAMGRWGEGRERPRGPLSGLCRPLPSSPTGRPEASRVSGIPKPEPP